MNNNTILKHTLYIGLNDKDTKTQLIDTLEATKIINNIVMEYAEGCTLYSCEGIYKHEDGSFTVEQSIKCEILFTERTEILKICNMLKLALHQESIAVQTENIFSELI